MQITQAPSPNRNIGRNGWVPDIIVCHITDGAFAGAVSWIQNPQSQVSYHYVVSQAGQIVQAVDIENTAWANGTDTTSGARGNQHSTINLVRERRVNANLYTISIGFEGRHSQTGGKLTPAQQAAGVRLIAHIIREVRRIYGRDIRPANIFGHSHIVPRWKPNCPGEAFPYDEIIKALINMPTLTQRFDRGGETIHIPAFNVDGTLYPELRPALEFAGIKFRWDSANRVVVIEE